uniref:Uncharacterized protein n=1 Tax=Anguilla anguilla TaxID=7936 RepID=A0A0E9TEM6_ANGAN
MSLCKKNEFFRRVGFFYDRHVRFHWLHFILFFTIEIGITCTLATVN